MRGPRDGARMPFVAQRATKGIRASRTGRAGRAVRARRGRARDRAGGHGEGGIVAVRQDNLGDVLLTGPALRALAAGGRAGRAPPRSAPGGEAGARRLPGVDEVLPRIAPWIDPEPPPVDREAVAAAVAEIAARRP